MANLKHVEIVWQGAEAIEKWSDDNPDSFLDLRHADLSGADLSHVDLSDAELSGADLTNAELSKVDLSKADLRNAKLSDAVLSGAILNRADLRHADLRDAELSGAKLSGADLSRADLTNADLTKANLRFAELSYANLSKTYLRKADLSGSGLRGADLSDADLSGAMLSGADLSGADLSRAGLSRADLTNAHSAATQWVSLDLSQSIGLESIDHWGPSPISVDTLFLSNGKIHHSFLDGCGLPEEFIQYIPSLVGIPFDFNSCFISYSNTDEEFAKRLHAALKTEKLKVWFAPEDMKSGKKLIHQIDTAIKVHDKLLLILSEKSMNSPWVIEEIRRAQKAADREGRQKLFPIRLVEWERIKNWELFDSDLGKDLAAEIREYYIPDFSNWKNHDLFQKELRKLLDSLRDDSDGTNES